MPDLTIEHAWVCDTNLAWEVAVPSSSGGSSHVVRWGRLWGSDIGAFGCEYGWSCTCPGFQFRLRHRGKLCKHILAVQDRRCGWNRETDPTSDAPDGKCPGCGGPVTSVRVAV